MDTCYGASMIDDLVLVCACCFTHVVLHPAASSTCCNAVCTHSGVTLVAMLSSNSCHRLCASVCAACLLSQSATFACCMQLLSCCSAHCWHVVSRAAGARLYGVPMVQYPLLVLPNALVVLIASNMSARELLPRLFNGATGRVCCYLACNPQS